ncbi:hypothetical protein [Methylobacterium nodulans]|uniref:Helix-turn-helix domain-containing protein n=1 Tax=Methylobacterium nodulans (strain LMG 21967 / CNCM I-2342 / ORS 2060) TaxID=460265 RepID=B8IPN5_METNO|nr:hypothetical protein [Methylobacterium nodulans]ACL62327.1 conserved hypothetical protein [Methylobacterium nodulans ORS 2060]
MRRKISDRDAVVEVLTKTMVPPRVVAAAMNVGERSIYSAIRKGIIPAVPVGRGKLIPTLPIRKMLALPAEAPRAS